MKYIYKDLKFPVVELFSIPDIRYIRAGEVSQAKSKQGTLPIHYYVAMSGIEISWTRIKVLENIFKL